MTEWGSGGGAPSRWKQGSLGKGVGKKFPEGANGKKNQKIAKKRNSTIKPLPGREGGNEKKTENWQKRPKIALLSLYLLYLYYI